MTQHYISPLERRLVEALSALVAAYGGNSPAWAEARAALLEAKRPGNGLPFHFGPERRNT